jgi:hypothetical protein
MKKLALSLLALLLLIGTVRAQPVFVPATTASVQVAGTVATTLLVTGVPGKQIYMTGGNLLVAATGTVQFIAGTGATCGTGTVNLTAVMTFTSQGFLPLGDGFGAMLVVPPGLSLCIVNGVAAGPGWLAYGIF